MLLIITVVLVLPPILQHPPILDLHHLNHQDLHLEDMNLGGDHQNHNLNQNRIKKAGLRKGQSPLPKNQPPNPNQLKKKQNQQRIRKRKNPLQILF